MSEALQSLAGAMQADVAALRTISQNIANAGVPAYRRQIALGTPDFDQLLPAPAEQLAALQSARDAVAIDRTAGTLKSTGDPLHLAIQGEGYFALQSEQGVRLTRRGDFQVSASGLLAAASGEPVLGSKGPIEIGTGVPTVLGDGTVRIGDNVIDQLQVVQAPDFALHYIGNALYAAIDAELTPLEQPSVRQGFLEAGNVTPVQEIVQMMETLRHFETAQRLLLGYEELQQRAISELGRTDQ
jgi:flagellar basal-body rod protein FlgF